MLSITNFKRPPFFTQAEKFHSTLSRKKRNKKWFLPWYWVCLAACLARWILRKFWPCRLCQEARKSTHCRLCSWHNFCRYVLKSLEIHLCSNSSRARQVKCLRFSREQLKSYVLVAIMAELTSWFDFCPEIFTRTTMNRRKTRAIPVWIWWQWWWWWTGGSSEIHPTKLKKNRLLKCLQCYRCLWWWV